MRNPNKLIAAAAVAAFALIVAPTMGSAQTPEQTPPAQTPPAQTPPAQTPPAQTPPPTQTPPAQTPPQAETTELDDETLRSFAEVYIEIEAIGLETEEQLLGVQDSEQALEIQAEARDQMMEVIGEHGFTQASYQEVGTALNQDAEARDRFVAILTELQQEQQGG